MRIGTTPTHTFTIPEEIAQVASKVRVIYAQGHWIVVTKDVERPIENKIVVRLTQEETLLFKNTMPVNIQLRILTETDDALTSDIITKSPYDCLEKEVLE